MLTEKIRALFAGCVYDEDPIKLIFNPESQYDEYDHEVQIICESVHIFDDVDHIQDKIYRVFVDQFGGEESNLAGSKEKYRGLAEKLYSIIQGPSEGDECPNCKCGTIVKEEGELRCAGECGEIWK
jgi:hypothetical protein